MKIDVGYNDKVNLLRIGIHLFVAGKTANLSVIKEKLRLPLAFVLAIGRPVCVCWTVCSVYLSYL